MPAQSKMEALVSLTTVFANLATLGAIGFGIYQLKKLTTGLEKPEKVGARHHRSRRTESNDGSNSLSRQVSETLHMPELGANIFAEKHGESFAKGRVVVRNAKTKETFVFDETPAAVQAMKNVFNRLCSTSAKVLSVNDVMKVHNLLGEPVNEDEKTEMTTFFETKNLDEKVVDFERFMLWWGHLHDSSADPDEYYSQERYRQRFKVLQSRLKNPSVAMIGCREEGDPASRRFRVHFQAEEKDEMVNLSPWHDIPLKNADGSYNFICEIPKWTRKKYEIATGEELNPIKQDVKNGVLREYKWGDMLFNYGAFPQTWEDPHHISEETGCPGDNDPIDVLELGSRQRPLGSITAVKILGVLAMIDADETDWKVLTIAMDDDKAPNLHDLVDLDAHYPGLLHATTHWLRMYKTAEGKGENRFGCGGKPMGAAFATKIVEETHQFWRNLLAQRNQQGEIRRKSSKDGHSIRGTNVTV